MRNTHSPPKQNVSTEESGEKRTVVVVHSALYMSQKKEEVNRRQGETDGGIERQV